MLIARTQVGEARPVATIALPREFRDRYELGEVLGSGAMGMVCRARDRSMRGGDRDHVRVPGRAGRLPRRGHRSPRPRAQEHPLHEGRTASASYASDVHAMGAILYEMVTGDPPFEAENLADLLRDILTRVPRALDQGMATPLPPALVRLVARALEKAPEARPTAEEFAAELRKAAGSRPRCPRGSRRRRRRRARPRWPLASGRTCAPG